MKRVLWALLWSTAVWLPFRIVLEAVSPLNFDTNSDARILVDFIPVVLIKGTLNGLGMNPEFGAVGEMVSITAVQILLLAATIWLIWWLAVLINRWRATSRSSGSSPTRP